MSAIEIFQQSVYSLHPHNPARILRAGPENVIGRYVDVEGEMKNEVQTTATDRR